MLGLMTGGAILAAQGIGAVALWPKVRVRPEGPALDPITKVRLENAGDLLRHSERNLTEARTALTRANEREALAATKATEAARELAALKAERVDLMRELSTARSAALQAEADLLAFEQAEDDGDEDQGKGAPPSTFKP